MKNEILDDSGLLDIIIENRVEEAWKTMDSETRTRMEDIQRIHAFLMETKAEEDRNRSGLSEAQMEAVLGRVMREERTSRAPLFHKGVLRHLRGKSLSWAAAILVLAVVGWVIIAPGFGRNVVYAAVFGGIDLYREGTAIRPVSHELKIMPGDTLVSTSGGMIDIDHVNSQPR